MPIFFCDEEGETPLVESGANAPITFKCCIENNRWAECLDWRVCRVAVRSKNGTHPDEICLPAAKFRHACTTSKPDFPEDGGRRRPSRAESGLLAETACLISKLKAPLKCCRSAFFAAAPDVGRQHPDPRPYPAAGDGQPSAPSGFESAAGKIRPGGILEASDFLQSEPNRQRSLGQTKTC